MTSKPYGHGRFWNSITSWLTSRDLVNLFRTGNKYLRNTLEKEGGVVDITHHVKPPESAFRGTPTFMSKSQLWPKFLLVRFRRYLLSFHITGITPLICIDCDPDLGLIDFQVLPPTITSLSIPFHFSFTPTLIKALPPSIRRLRLSQEYGLRDIDVELFPPTLTTLELPAHRKMGQIGAGGLPVNLRKLILTVNDQYDSATIRVLAQVCKELTYLDLSHAKFEDDSLNMALFPTKLRHLSLASVTSCIVDTMAFLPSRLTVLELTNLKTWGDTTMAILPRSLTMLNLENASNFSEVAIKSLPSRLCRLSLGVTTQLAHVGICSLPSTLCHLSLDLCTAIGDTSKMTENFPRLTHLSLNSLAQVDEKMMSNFPKILTYLSLVKARTNREAFRQLPPNLRFLSMPNSPSAWHRCWEEISPNIFQMLPVPLSLSLLQTAAVTYINRKFAQLFFKFPVDIYLERQPPNAMAKEDKQYPPSIPDTRQPHYDSHIVPIFLTPGGYNTNELPVSPIRTRITFPVWTMEYLTTSSLGLLARNVEYLDLTQAKYLTGFIPQLPKVLKELYMPIEGTHDSSQFHLLPPKLEVLYIGDEAHNHLPSGLLSVESITDSLP